MEVNTTMLEAEYHSATGSPGTLTVSVMRPLKSFDPRSRKKTITTIFASGHIKRVFPLVLPETMSKRSFVVPQ